MSVQSSTVYKPIEQTSNSIFFKKPHFVQINEEAVTRYSTSEKIEILIEELQEMGPLIALGKVGPKFYKDAPKLKGNVCGEEVYGWKSGSLRNEISGQSCVMILGAKKTDDQELVFYTFSEDITENKKSMLRQHIPSNTDSKVYVTSHKTFCEYLFDLYPPTMLESPIFFISSRPNTIPTLSIAEKVYAENLATLDLESILDSGVGEKKCVDLGQKAFNQFKAEANGDSFAGKRAIVNICNSMITLTRDGALRKQYIERAWDGVGDKNWKWQK